MRALIGIALALARALASRTAAAEPSNRDLVFAGLLMAPPTYLLNVTLHEGSHALMAEAMGGDVTGVRLFPPGVDPRSKKFRFGWVYASGLRTKPQKLAFYLAPKMTGGLLLGGFAALVLTDAWPENRYGQLALTVVGTGLWVDFSKDLLLFSRHNDVVKAFHLWCMRGWKQVPARLVYAGLVAGSGYVVARAYQKTFDTQDGTPAPRMIPLLSSRF